MPVAGGGTVVSRLTVLLPLLLLRSGTVAPLVMVAGVWVGNIYAGLAANVSYQNRQTAVAKELWQPAEPCTWTDTGVIRITGWVRPGESGKWSVPGIVMFWAEEGAESWSQTGPRAGDGVLLRGSDLPPLPGTIVGGQMVARVPPRATVPGAFDYRRYLQGRGLVWQVECANHETAPGTTGLMTAAVGQVAAIRSNVLKRLEYLLPPDEAHLAAAVLLGVRASDSRRLSAPFSGVGLAHLFAVSGLHVGVLLGLVLLPGRLAGWSPGVSLLPLWGFLPLYLLLTGMPGSVVRAGGMAMLVAHAKVNGRRADPLRLLGLLYWLGTLWSPTQNLDGGLQLSYLAAAGILIISRLTDGFDLTSQRWLRPVLAGLGVGLAAVWFTLPVIGESFGQISLVSPLTNLVVVPLFGLVVWILVVALLVSAISLPVAQWLAAIAWLMLRSLRGAVAWVVQSHHRYPWGIPTPGAWQYLGWVGLTLVLVAVLWRVSNRGNAWSSSGRVACALCPIAVLWLFGPRAHTLFQEPVVEVWQFDVGQGDCGYLKFPDGWSAIIDTGGRYGRLAGPRSGPLARDILPWLGRYHLNHVDAVLLTHGHRDHVGGAAALVDACEVDRWFVSGTADFALRTLVDTLQVWRPGAGFVLHRWRQWDLAIDYPLADQKSAPSENNWSLVVSLRHAGRTMMLWSGDLELAGEAALLATGRDLPATVVWKAGHHGSDTSGSAALLQRLQPRLILISCGVGNSYGHPSHGPYEMPGASTRQPVILRTDLDGSIALRWHKSGALAVTTVGSRRKLDWPP